jgi:hypothetical protein
VRSVACVRRWEDPYRDLFREPQTYKGDEEKASDGGDHDSYCRDGPPLARSDDHDLLEPIDSRHSSRNEETFTSPRSRSTRRSASKQAVRIDEPHIIVRQRPGAWISSLISNRNHQAAMKVTKRAAGTRSKQIVAQSWFCWVNTYTTVKMAKASAQ